MALKYFMRLGKILDSKNYITTVGDEGGYAPNLSSNKEALDVIMSAIEKAGYKPGEDIALALDVASSEFYKDNWLYYLASENKKYSSSEFIQLIKSWTQQYPIVSVEDALDENDWTGWAELTKELGNTIQLVGDDLFVTNPSIFKEGIKKNIANAIFIKLNQIGTLTETLEAMDLAKKIIITQWFLIDLEKQKIHLSQTYQLLTRQDKLKLDLYQGLIGLQNIIN